LEKIKVKIAVITDAHGNLPALKAALKNIEEEGCDAVYHTGDAVGIGPFPNESLDLLISKKVKLTMGNHDKWYAYGLPNPQPDWMTNGEVEHQKWIHNNIDPSYKTIVSKFPYYIKEKIMNFNMLFIHYGLQENQVDFLQAIKNPSEKQLNHMYSQFDADIIFYGHQHIPSDIKGSYHYINPGSLGCSKSPVARLSIIELSDTAYRVRNMEIPYNDSELFLELERRSVPERDFIKKIFFSRG